MLTEFRCSCCSVRIRMRIDILPHLLACTLRRVICFLLFFRVFFSCSSFWCYNRQLAKLLSGFVTGQSLGCWGSCYSRCTVICGENGQQLHSSSVFPSGVSAVCRAWFSLDLSLVPCYDAGWRTLVCFRSTNRQAKNIRSRSFCSAMLGTRARIRREPCKMGAIHQNFAPKKAGDTESARNMKCMVHAVKWMPVRSFGREFFLCLDFKGNW